MDFLPVYRLIWWCLGLQTVWALDEVTLLNPPAEALPDQLLDVLYSCDEPATVRLDCVVSFETGGTSTLLLRQWSCIPGDPEVRTVRLNLPDWLVYRDDGVVSDSDWVLSCILRASLRSGGDAVTAQDVAALQPRPFFSRPVRRWQRCVDWGLQMLETSRQLLLKQCPVEQETVQLLSWIYASTGENFGVTRTLEPFGSEALEFLRAKDVASPWCTFTLWMFVTKHCEERLCGVFYHIDSYNDYSTPALFLKQSGQLHIQLTGASEESSAFLSPFKIPLRQWCRLSVTLQGRTASVSMLCLDGEQRTEEKTEHTCKHDVVLDDTDGYFVIGGGSYVKGVEGYFGPVQYFRSRAPPLSSLEAVLPRVIESVNLTGWLHTCQDFRQQMSVRLSGYSLRARRRTESGRVCPDVLHEWLEQESRPPLQCEQWESAAPLRRPAATLAKSLAFKYGGRPVGLPALGRALYSLSLRRLSRAGGSGPVRRTLPLLLQAGCLADSRALYTSSVLLGTGLGVHRQPWKSWLLALLAAQSDHRLALLHLGHLHQQGLRGLPSDPDLAYAYYANVAKQTTLDRHNHTAQQTFVEAVYLNDDEDLNLQTSEDHHIFQWLKLQARQGATEAERTIARMLFWGQQGVSPNIQEAVRHYRRGAVQWKDPASMYDYGIVLLQGHGVEQDVPKAVMFLKKAMEQGFVPAINALAWYYEQHEQDYERAVQLWEQADVLGSPEAALNLGVMYSRGLYPGKLSSQYMAYKYYLKSAERGHIRGAVQLADIWITGIPGLVRRRPSDAVLWSRWAAEHNGYLGSVLRRALDSYLKNHMFSSLLHYLMAAEAGFAAAQFNVAFLCEEKMDGILDPGYASRCMWRFYNLTIQSGNPNTYAFIKLGDLLYEGSEDRRSDLLSAAHMYAEAARRNDPQGWFNLGLLVQEGFRLPLSVLAELGLSDLYLADSTLLLTALYKRCRDLEDSESYLPCSMALFSVYLQSFQRDYSAADKLSMAVAVVAGPAAFLLVLGALRGRLLSG
ncbi:protein sel-1 homolog 3 isoform X2 [Salarias fasciatus]|uniref:Protein sel-1 homolog 3-like n=1 Tax=Salarias fasciatus TaxID=181472 RepID=A0A672FYK4_SALFA|nr:protein sel-1 homolog 3-like isoform X2 [Salarias fasciatus]